MDFLPIKRAILSVTDKAGLVEFAKFLSDKGVELISTGGTHKTLEQAGLTVKQVSEVTSFPEIMGGRVKTLHPNIHGGILADKDNAEHLKALKNLSIQTFDLVCVNLYNFAEAVCKGLELKQAVDEIDIGGPCMMRAAAKNYHSIMVVPSVAFYPEIIESLRTNSMKAPLPLRQKTAQAAFAITSAYDKMISDYLSVK